ncbi:MAG: hypothetical protein VB071_04880 [Lawsonibacter sp.]|nr:hypothetical protein [Lawsonibacter sp.]
MGIAAVKLNDEGCLIITLTDGCELNAGNIREAVAANSGGIKTSGYEDLILPGFIIAMPGLVGNAGLLIHLISKRRR